MRRIFRLSVLGLTAAVVSACEPDEIVRTTPVPTAGVRFINAVPDTGGAFGVDFRFVDMVESNAHFRITYRNNPVTAAGVTASTQIQYKNARVGARQYRIFLNDTIQSIAQTVLKEGTLNLVEGTNYTVLLQGYARRCTGTGPTADCTAAGAMNVTVIDETVPAPTAGRVALRVLNTTAGPIDVRVFPTGTAVPATATWANVAPFSASLSYVELDTTSITYNVQPAGGGTQLVGSTGQTVPTTANAVALLGAPASASGITPCGSTNQPVCDIDAVPGTRISGTAVSMVVFPGALPYSRAPQTNVFLYTTGGAALSATATGYARAAGSFTTDGFAAGMTITASGFTNPANNGPSVVTAVAALTITVTKAGGTVAEAGQAGTGFTDLGATATGYTRSAGSFVTDGFTVGMVVKAEGFANTANNNNAVVTAVSAGTLTVTKVPVTLAAPTTVVEAEGPNRKITDTAVRNLAAERAGVTFMWDRRPPSRCAPLC